MPYSRHQKKMLERRLDSVVVHKSWIKQLLNYQKGMFSRSLGVTDVTPILERRILRSKIRSWVIEVAHGNC